MPYNCIEHNGLDRRNVRSPVDEEEGEKRPQDRCISLGWQIHSFLL